MSGRESSRADARRAEPPASATARPAGPPRIEDVAAAAGTSPITVSRAFRHPELLAAATRARVLDAVESLGYIPNLSASSLASRRSGFLAVLVPTIDNSIFAETFAGVADAVAGVGLQLLLGDYGYSEKRERSLLHALIGRKPEALVIVGAVRHRQMRRQLSGLAIPIIETWELSDDPIDVVVGFSNSEAGRAVARHLVAKGRRRIAFVGGTDQRSQARAGGLRQGLREAGVDALTHLRATSDVSIGGGRAALANVLETAPQTDAVFFSSDVLAVGGLLECQRRGVEVPAELAVAGLGDLEIARELIPSLTTVRVPAYEIGRRAGEIVAARIAGLPSTARIIDVGFEVIAREST